jgi:hypothetical protein
VSSTPLAPRRQVSRGTSSNPDAVLSRSDLRELGYERRAVDAIFRSCPVVALHGLHPPACPRRRLSRVTRSEHLRRKSCPALTRRAARGVARTTTGTVAEHLAHRVARGSSCPWHAGGRVPRRTAPAVPVRPLPPGRGEVSETTQGCETSDGRGTPKARPALVTSVHSSPRHRQHDGGE